MLTVNDSAKIVQQLANDLITREMHDIVGSMNNNSKVQFVNGVRSLNEIAHNIEREASRGDSLVFITSD